MVIARIGKSPARFCRVGSLSCQRVPLSTLTVFLPPNPTAGSVSAFRGPAMAVPSGCLSETILPPREAPARISVTSDRSIPASSLSGSRTFLIEAYRSAEPRHRLTLAARGGRDVPTHDHSKSAQHNPNAITISAAEVFRSDDVDAASPAPSLGRRGQISTILMLFVHLFARKLRSVGKWVYRNHAPTHK